MYRMLIVDDEDQIREGIRKMLNWPDYNVEICGEASNGREALKLMEACPPDFVLTDIRMPEMDGLTLLNEVKKRGLQSKMVVLSGYNDFLLVKEAMKCGAVDYLLKPAGRAEMLQLIEEQLVQTDAGELFQWTKDETLKNARNNFFNRMVSDSMTALEFREKQELFEIDLETGDLAVARLAFSENASVQNPHVKTGILELCQMFLEERQKGYAFCSLSGGVVCVLTDVCPQDIHLGCKELLCELLQLISRKFSAEMFFSVSMPVKSYRNLWKAYQEAEQTAKYHFVFDTAQLLFFGEIEAYYQGKEAAVLIDQGELGELIKEGNPEEFAAYLEQRLGSGEDMLQGDTYVHRNRAMEIIIFLFQFLIEQFAVDRGKLTRQKDRALNRLAGTRERKRIQDFLLELLQQAAQYYRNHMKMEYSRIVYDAICRVKEQYDDVDLSLQYLAEEFGVNAAYLGRIFKKETGASFANYLNSYRVEAAMRLLKETNRKGSEIYKMVGFSNYNYFYIVFKKITGQNPMEIRGSDRI